MLISLKHKTELLQKKNKSQTQHVKSTGRKWRKQHTVGLANIKASSVAEQHIFKDLHIANAWFH